MLTKTLNWIQSALTHKKRWTEYWEPIIQWFKPNWQAENYSAQITAVRTEQDGMLSLVLRPQKNWPGFKAGQHIDLIHERNGRRFYRTFSLSHAPSHFSENGLIELTIRKQSKGKITADLDQWLSPNDWINITEARGHFTLPNQDSPLLLVAGGSGITPFRSMLHEMANKQSHRQVDLMYYTRTESLPFTEEWTWLSQQLPGLTIHHFNTSQTERINNEHFTQFSLDVTDRTAYLCGPPGMIETAKQSLMNLGLDPSNMHHESFGPSITTPSTLNSNTKVHFAASDVVVEHASQNTPQSLLMTAEAAKLNPLSGCRMGVCHQCQCRKKQGVVYNTLTQQFSEAGSEDIQLCVSIPATDVTLEL